MTEGVKSRSRKVSRKSGFGKFWTKASPRGFRKK